VDEVMREAAPEAAAAVGPPEAAAAVGPPEAAAAVGPPEAAAAAAAAAAGDAEDVEMAEGPDQEDPQEAAAAAAAAAQEAAALKLARVRELLRRRKAAVAAATAAGEHPWLHVLQELTGAESKLAQACLTANRATAKAARLEHTALLPEALQQEAAEKLAAAQALRKQYNQPSEVPGFDQLAVRHAVDAAPCRQYLLQRRWCVMAKHRHVATLYRQRLTVFRRYSEKGWPHGDGFHHPFHPGVTGSSHGGASHRGDHGGGRWGGGGGGGGGGPHQGPPLRATRSNSLGVGVIRSALREEEIIKLLEAQQTLKEMTRLPEQVRGTGCVCVCVLCVCVWGGGDLEG
jgi:uncharacterized membrane protein YgcG